jgi:hypothetical protein
MGELTKCVFHDRNNLLSHDLHVLNKYYDKSELKQKHKEVSFWLCQCSGVCCGKIILSNVECVQPLLMSATWDFVEDVHHFLVMDESELVLLLQTRSTHVQHMFIIQRTSVLQTFHCEF